MINSPPKVTGPLTATMFDRVMDTLEYVGFWRLVIVMWVMALLLLRMFM